MREWSGVRRDKFAMRINVAYKGFCSYQGAAVGLLTCLWLMPQSLSVQADNRASHGKPATKAGHTATEPSRKQVRKEIQAVYDQQSAALNRKDVPGFLALCTPDYQDMARGKRLHKAQFIRQTLPRTLAKYSTLAMSATIKTLEVKDSQATVTATHQVKVTFLPRYSASASPRISETVTQDIWIKTDEGWRTKRTKEIGYKRQPLTQPARPSSAKPAIEKTAAPPAR